MGKKIFAAIFAILLLFSCTACHMVFVNEEKDFAQAVATINGVEITKGDVIAIYNTYRYSNKLTPENQMTEEYIETYKTVLQKVYDTLIEYQLILQYGDKYASTEITDAMREKIDADIKSLTDSITTSIKSDVEEAAAKDPTMNVDEEVAARLAAQLEYRGISTGAYKTRLEMEAIMDAVGDVIRAAYAPTDEDLQEYYESELVSQKDLITQDISYYEYFEAYYLNLYMPDGFKYVKNLLIALPEDIQTQISTLRENGDDAAADTLLEAELAKISGSAQEVYNRIESGEDYDALLAQYGQDPGMEEGAYYATTGYRLYEGMSGYEENFLTAAFALQNVGDVSAPIASDYGYYILKYMGDSEAHAVPLEDVREKLEENMISEKSQDLYDEVMENWKRSATITEYSDRLYE